MMNRRSIAAMLTAASVASLSAGAILQSREHRHALAPVTYVGITSACAGTGGITALGFTLATPSGKTWNYVADKGGALTQLGGGAQVRVAGVWTKVPTTSGGEGRVRFTTVPDADLVKLVYAGWTSPAVTPSGLNCSA